MIRPLQFEEAHFSLPSSSGNANINIIFVFNTSFWTLFTISVIFRIDSKIPPLRPIFGKDLISLSNSRRSNHHTFFSDQYFIILMVPEQISRSWGRIKISFGEMQADCEVMEVYSWKDKHNKSNNGHRRIFLNFIVSSSCSMSFDFFTHSPLVCHMTFYTFTVTFRLAWMIDSNIYVNYYGAGINDQIFNTLLNLYIFTKLRDEKINNAALTP